MFEESGVGLVIKNYGRLDNFERVAIRESRKGGL